MDETLIKRLLQHPPIKKHFFKDIAGVVVFDKITFQRFISNKQHLPDSYTAFKNTIGLTANEEYLTESKEIVLAWPYKDCVLEGGQTKEDQRRKEIFWNETLAPDQIDRLLAPKVLTNFKKHDKAGAHEVTSLDFDDNLIIKGNNLLALHSLKKKYTGKVKLIYIDPPFNTDNDSFQYNDTFNHSTWLTFMKNRLQIAKELLREDGTIFIHHDDKEYSYLKALCDEIFSKNNFLNNIVVKTSDPSGHKTVNPSPYSQTEYILLYAKNKAQYKYDIQYTSSDYDTGYNKHIENIGSPYEKWIIKSLNEKVAIEKGFQSAKEARKSLGKTVFSEAVAEFSLDNCKSIFQATAISNAAGGEIVKLRDKSKLTPNTIFCFERPGLENIYIRNGRQLYFYSSKIKVIDGIKTPAKPLTNLWVDIPYNGISYEGKVTLKNGKKPEKLLRRIIEMSTDPGDIVLDYHLGSGTTCAVSHKMGRRYIGIEQLNYGENDSVVRMKNVIKGEQTGISKALNWQSGGSFVYCELARHNAKVIEDIETAHSTKQLKELWQKIQDTDFISHKVNPKVINENIREFEALSVEEQKRFLIEVLDKNQLYVNYSEIDDEDYTVSGVDKKLNKQFYGES